MPPVDTGGAAAPLALASALTAQTQVLCQGIESGTADVLQRVTPITAELLSWWFGADRIQERAGPQFHAGQRQAILNTIVAHEVLGSGSLLDLYREVLPEALNDNALAQELGAPRHGHPKYCLKMATGTGKTWVLQALLVWQLLNHNAAVEAGVTDARFTRHFLVVAPGLVVYDRLLDAFCGRRVEGDDAGLARDFDTADIVQFGDLFVPDEHRAAVLAFVRHNVCARGEIGLRTTGNGLIAITNWHLLVDGEAPDGDEKEGAGGPLAPHDVVAAVLPLVPGYAAGNSLDVLDRRHARGHVLDYLAALPALLVFNDEAHHIHQVRRAGENTEVEWQKSLGRIAHGKGRSFVQIDFSATPYNDVGGGARARKRYFPHIVADFDLPSAMRAGLVKSLVLDRRREVGALPLDFQAVRDAEGRPALSDGQRVMLRAGLQKLRRLEADFARIDPERHPKMLVVCESTEISPLVAAFLQEDEGLAPDDIVQIDSGKKAMLGESEWQRLRTRLSHLDRHATPRVVLSVLMLREGFDVANICVIVPLRASNAPILLEQTIGRGLRLMWREPEYRDLKRDNRERIATGQEPNSLLDVLSIVEHPAFQAFYDDLRAEGLVGTTDGDQDHVSATADLVQVERREDYAAYDFAIPFVLRDADEQHGHAPLDVGSLPPFSAMPREGLAALLGRGEQFVSQDFQSATLFGDYRVAGEVMQVAGYNDWLARLTRRIAHALGEPLPRQGRTCPHAARPYMQTGMAELTGWIDDYVWTRLFDAPFNPLQDAPDGTEHWRLLLLRPVVEHIVRVFALALRETEERRPAAAADVRHRHLSEVPRLVLRTSHSVAVSKCIYTRLGWPAHQGGLERAFILWAQADTQVHAFCKLHEQRHAFVRLRYVKEDGLSAFYAPDFLVRTADAIYLVETKAQAQTFHPDVLRKARAALAWCDRINALPADSRSDLPWHYVLLGEVDVLEWQQKGARLTELLSFARLRPAPQSTDQSRLI